jgi:type VI secretion system protein ImpJ
MKMVQPLTFATAIEDDKYLSGTKMYLAVASATPSADCAKKIPLLAKVGSATQVEQLVRRALPGIDLTHVAKPPAAIPVDLNYQYFSLNQAGQAWDGVGKSRTLAAFIPGEIQEPQVELIIVLPQPL